MNVIRTIWEIIKILLGIVCVICFLIFFFKGDLTAAALAAIAYLCLWKKEREPFDFDKEK